MKKLLYIFMALVFLSAFLRECGFDSGSSFTSSGNSTPSNNTELVTCPHCDGTGKRYNQLTGVYGVCGTCNGTGRVKQGDGYKYVK